MPKPIFFLGPTRADLNAFPLDVRKEVGFALYQAEQGDKSVHAIPLVGFGGAGVLEVVSDHDGDTYRSVYTVKFELAAYVLHCFKKKSKTGRATPRRDLNLVKSRLKLAEQHHAELVRQSLEKQHEQAG